MRILATIAALLFATAAHAAVYQDCSSPVSNGAVWHIDAAAPAGGDGSAAHPWNSLKAVFTLQPGYTHTLLTTAPYDHYPKTSPITGVRFGPDAVGDPTRINPGDKVLLATGSYGDISAIGGGTPINNVDANGATAWVTFDAEPGAAPQLSTLAIASARGLAFQNLNVISTLTDGSASNSAVLVKVSDGGAALATKDIALLQNTIGSALTMPAWTQAQWRNARTGIQIVGSVGGTHTKCVTAAHNTIRFVNGGFATSQATEVVFDSNLVDYFAGDGGDLYSTSNATYRYNLIEDRVDAGNGTHTDCMQLAFNSSNHSTAAAPWHDIVIDHNTCIRLAHSDNPFPGYLQGIFHTNDIYDHVQITNNKIVVAACTGLALSATNSLVANNTVVRDGAPDTLTPGCTSLDVSVKGGTAAGPTLAANNVVTGNYGTDLGTTWQNNIAVPPMSGGVPQNMGSSYLALNGAMKFVGAGVYPGVTILSLPNDSTVFADYNPPLSGLNSISQPDLSPAIGGILVGKGVMVAPPNIGAF